MFDPVLILKREILLYEPDDILLNKEKLTKLQDSLANHDLSYVDELWNELEEQDYDYICDKRNGFRERGTDTGLGERECSRHYECKEVAHPITGLDFWIGWTYWYGGGKHGEPESIRWIDDAYLIEVTTEMRPVQIFKPL